MIVDLSQFDESSKDTIWLDPLISSASDDELFVATDKGRVYLACLNVSCHRQAVLDLSKSLTPNTFNALTAIALHPSFTEPDVPGYATFYTAHTAEFEQGNYTNRLLLNEPISTFSYETVITAWTYDFKKQQINPLSHREVIRIPINDPTHAIKQLAFEPYLKPWHADYGQLYFSLGYAEQLKLHSLYSGAILRIHPMLFGARNYTVSETNPFLKKPEVSNEIVIFGGHNIEHFFWTKYSHNTIFVRHNDSEQFWLSKAKVGVKLDSQPHTNILMHQSSRMPTILLYQGRNFFYLRNKIVYLTLLDERWHLSSVPLESEENEFPISNEVINTQALTTSSQLSIHIDSQNEMIIFDHAHNKLYALEATELNTGANSQDANVLPPVDNSTTPSEPNKIYIWLACLLMVTLSMLLMIRHKKSKSISAKNVLNNQYVRLEYTQNGNAIELYKSNIKKPQLGLHLNMITGCEILLNNELIIYVDGEPENVISNKIETEIRARFSKEEKRKMLVDQTREIKVVLSNKDDSYPICLYLRKGNSRVTGEKYFRVVDMVIDLCWTISKQLNPQETETRIVPVVISRPNLPSSAKKATKQPLAKLADDNNSLKEQKNDEQVATNPQEQEVKPTELVDSLEKLVELHKQGYLSDEEFSLAKANLLR